MKESNFANMSAFPEAPLRRRLAALVYDSFIVFSFLLLATTFALALNQGESLLPYRAYFLIYLFISTGVFLAWFWAKSGQTLGMLAWKIRLINKEGTTVCFQKAFLRYIAAFFSIGCCGIGLLWCLIDKNKETLHDKLLGTRVIKYQR